MKRRLLSILTALALCLTLLPVTASAESVTYYDYDGTQTSCTDPVPVTAGDTAWGTSGNTSYYAAEGNVTLASRPAAAGEVHLILKDGCTLTAPAGIGVSEGNMLFIHAQSAGESMGALIADCSGKENVAGIGGGNNESSGIIVICGGAITATGGYCAAGIGGGANGSGNGITVCGGEVTAAGGTYAAGIGGGIYGEANVGIRGGRITATGKGGAGIGSGGVFGADLDKGKGKSCSVTISGGTVTAHGDWTRAAGIGYGMDGSGEITITGGTVTADGSGAGIGGSKLTVTNGTVTAAVDEYLCAIDCAEVLVTGGTVEASSPRGAASVISSRKVTVSGGSLTASSGYGNGAGIYCSEALTVMGGTLVARNDSKGKSNPGACIKSPNVRFFLGTVTVEAAGGGRGVVSDHVVASSAASVKLSACSSAVKDDEGEAVYLYTVSNPEGQTVYIGGEGHTVKAHAADDKNVYVYLKAGAAGSTHKILTSRALKKVYYDTAAEEWKEAPGGYEIIPGALTYTGGAQALVSVSGTAEVTYSTSAEGTLSAAVPTGTAVGGYKVWYSVAGYESGARQCVDAAIGKAPLTVTANDKTIAYGDAPANAGVHFTGFVGGEDAAVLTGTPAYAYDYEQYDDAGEYEITPSGYSSDNYDISCEKGTLTVGQRPLTAADCVIRNTGTVAYDGETHTASVELASGLSGAGTVSLQYTADGGTTFTDAPTAVGAYRVYVRATGGDNLKATTGNGIDTGRTLTIASVVVPKAVTFTLGGLEQIYDGGAKSVTVTPGDVDATYSVTYDGSTEAPTLPGVYTVAVTANGGYSGAKYALFTVKKAPVTGVSFSQSGGVYGTAIPDALITGADGFTTAVSYGATGSEKPVKAGSYTATLTVSAENYETLTLTSDFTIEKAELTVTPQNARRYKGEANPVVELAYSGWQYGEDESVLLGIPVASFTADASSPVGEYDITLSRGYAENYTFVYGTAKLTVAALPSDTPGRTPDPVVPEKETDVTKCRRDARCPLAGFTDADTAEWYHDGIHYCIDRGLMSGTSATTFEPGEPSSRGQIVTILYYLEGRPARSGADPFTDVPRGSYYEMAVLWATDAGIVQGYGDGTFGPEDPITREQMATILSHYAAYKGVDVSGDASRLAAFADAGDVSDYALTAMAWGVSSGLIRGDGGKLLPGDEASRAESAVLIMNYCEKILGGF